MALLLPSRRTPLFTAVTPLKLLLPLNVTVLVFAFVTEPVPSIVLVMVKLLVELKDRGTRV